MISGSDIIKVFDENSSKYNNSIIDSRIFELVRGTLLEDSSYDQDEITLLDEQMLSNSLNQIKKNMRNMHSCKEYSGLSEKLKQLEQLIKRYNEVDKILDNPCYKRNIELETLYSESGLKIKYLLIELRTAVGLDLDSIALCDVVEYCTAIACDVNNGKYKTLTIEDHIDEENKRISNIKVKVK